jgi:hypothetical protein
MNNMEMQVYIYYHDRVTDNKYKSSGFFGLEKEWLEEYIWREVGVTKFDSKLLEIKQSSMD